MPEFWTTDKIRVSNILYTYYMSHGWVQPLMRIGELQILISLFLRFCRFPNNVFLLNTHDRNLNKLNHRWEKEAKSKSLERIYGQVMLRSTKKILN